MTGFGTGFSDHIQGNTPLYTDLTANPVHTLLHLAMVTIASLYGIGGRWQQLIIKKRALPGCVTIGQLATSWAGVWSRLRLYATR